MATLAEIGNFWHVGSGPMYERFLGACLKSSYDAVRGADMVRRHWSIGEVAPVVLSSSCTTFQPGSTGHLSRLENWCVLSAAVVVNVSDAAWSTVCRALFQTLHVATGVVAPDRRCTRSATVTRL